LKKIQLTKLAEHELAPSNASNKTRKIYNDRCVHRHAPKIPKGGGRKVHGNPVG